MMLSARLLVRAADLIGGPVAFAFAVTAAGWAPMTLDLTDALLLFLAAAATIAFAPRVLDTLAVRDPLEPQDFASLGLYNLYIYMVLAGVWSLNAGAVHGPEAAGLSIGLRLAFRVFAVRGLVLLLAAQGIVGDGRVPVGRWLRIGAVALAAVTALALIDLGGDRIAAIRARVEMSDEAPAPRITHDAP